MRILHLGWGFRPWRVGGLIAYVEDLMGEQVARGHAVGYLYNGRHYPGLGRPRLQPLRGEGIERFELMGSVHPQGGDQGILDPDLDLREPVQEAAFTAVLRRFAPDVLHIQELGGFPSSVIDLARDAGVPTVMTTHDYVPLCPTVKLFDADEQVCRRQAPGAMCRVCCAGAPEGDGHLVTQTLMFHAIPGGDRGRGVVRDLVSSLRDVPLTGRLVNEVLTRFVPGTAGDEPPGPQADALRSAPADAYDRRRAVNVERLNRLDLLLPNSTRVADIYAGLGVDRERIRTTHLIPRHVASIRMGDRVEVATPLRFATLNGCASTQKGAGVVVDALRALRERGATGRFALDVWGYVAPNRRAELLEHPEVTIRGSYTTGELTQILAEPDVGIVPSAWEETFGFTGVECLAAGVPLIGNARGGITDYTVDGRTGWVNRPADGAGLAALMARLVEAPDEVVALRRRLRAEPSPLVRTLAAHADDLDGVYADVVARRR